MSAELRRRIAEQLANHSVLSLATIGSAGPHATNLFYACDDLALIWVSDVDAQHSREIEADPRVAATIASQYENYASIQGLQITGMAHKVAGRERTRCLSLFEVRHFFLSELASASPELQDAYLRVVAYRLQPLSIVLIDNTQGFGHKETLNL